MTTVDINTVIIPDDKRIWVVHPGKHKKFFADFEQNSRIYLEYPGMSLRPADFDDDGVLRQKIRYSLEMQHFEGFVRADGSPIRQSDFDTGTNSAIAVYLRTVKHLFENMQIGDLIVSPGYGPYSRILFGELIEPVNLNLRARIPPHVYVETEYRRVKWLTTDRKKFELPDDLIKLVNKPPAIAEVGRDANTDCFFDFAYRAYVKEGQSWSTIRAPTYRGNDPTAISDPSKLIEFAVAAFRAIEQGESLADLSMDEIVERFYSTRDIELFGMSYQSPGRLDFKARNTKLSIFVCLVIALASAGALSGCKASGQPISVHNSAAHHDPISPQLQEQLNLMVAQIGEPTARQADGLGQRAHSSSGLTTVVTVQP